MNEEPQGYWPIELALSQQGSLLTIQFETGDIFTLTAELLRVESPSAEVKGHGSGQETLQWGKRDVFVRRIEPVGNYAVRLHFSDGHNTGLYTWNYLFTLGREAETRLADYLAKLKASGHNR